MKKAIVYIITILTCILMLSACRQEAKVPREEQIKMICELSTLKCFYNNVAKRTIPGNWLIKEREIWMEYEGYAEFGIDMNLVSIAIKDNEVIVKMPKAKVVHCGIKRETLNEDSYIISEGGWFFPRKITVEEQTEMMVQAQAEMKAEAENNTTLLNQSEQRAKCLIENYINRLGDAVGITYEIKWEMAESGEVISETTAA